MNGSSTNSSNNSKVSERPCGLIALLPSFSMSCRGHAENFAKRLQTKLRELGSQDNDNKTDENLPIIDGNSTTWFNNERNIEIKNVQPVALNNCKNETYYGNDNERISPKSPANINEYPEFNNKIKSIPQTSFSSDSNVLYSSTDQLNYHSPDSQSSSDGPFYDLDNSEEQSSNSTDFYDCLDSKAIKNQIILINGHTNSNGNSINYSNNLTEFLPLKPDTIRTDISNLKKNGSNSYCMLQDYLEIDSNEMATIAIKHNEDFNINKLSHKNTENGRLDEQILSEEKYKEINENNKDEQLCNLDEEYDCKAPRIRRCSSLKSGKTPPGTPACKKIVRFADVLGLDLADVKTFLDDIPTVPISAYEDLEYNDIQQIYQLGKQTDKILVPMFQQPVARTSFLDIVKENQVLLENAAVTDPINMTIHGCVRVRNLDFHKSVYIRYTLDNWKSYADLRSNYVENSCDGFSDKFSFIIYGNSLNIGQNLQFAVCFQCKGDQFWDNNFGNNYVFQCLPQSNTIINKVIIPQYEDSSIYISDSWSNSFY